MRDVYEVAQRHGISVHLDGARIFNAAVALDVPVTALTRHCDTVSCCLSKGLCAPVGAVLAGPERVIHRARKYRKMLGGGMRQVGFLAAAARIALTEMPAHLALDHENARHMAGKLKQIPGVSLDMDAVEINMVFFHVARERAVLDALPARMLEAGVKINGHSDGLFRFVTNHDVSRSDVDRAVEVFEGLLG